MAVHCRKCSALLAVAAEIRLLTDHMTGAVSLCIHPSVAAKIKSIYRQPNPEPKNSVAPYKMFCTGCQSDVGSCTKLTVSDHLVDCFSSERASFVTPDSNTLPAKKWKVMTEELKASGVEPIHISEAMDTISKRLPSAEGNPEFRTVYCDVDKLSNTVLQSLTIYEPRDYQAEMARSALECNSLICMPTGAGKTLIAASVMHAMLRLNPRKMAIFIVNTVALVEQQAKQLETQISCSKVERLHGKVEQQRKIAKVCGECYSFFCKLFNLQNGRQL